MTKGDKVLVTHPAPWAVTTLGIGNGVGKGGRGATSRLLLLLAQELLRQNPAVRTFL
jgi:hypothetical protein